MVENTAQLSNGDIIALTLHTISMELLLLAVKVLEEQDRRGEESDLEIVKAFSEIAEASYALNDLVFQINRALEHPQPFEVPSFVIRTLERYAHE